MLVPVVEPIVIEVVDPASPPVPKAIVLVEPDAVAPAWIFVVWFIVDCPTVIIPVPAVPPITIVPVVSAEPNTAFEPVVPVKFNAPVIVGLMLVSIEDPVPDNVPKPLYSGFHDAAPVPEVDTQVTVPDIPGVRLNKTLPPDEKTPTLLLVLLLIIL